MMIKNPRRIFIEEKNMCSMIQASLSFPDEYFEGLNLLDQEVSDAKVKFRVIFDYKESMVLDVDNIHYSQLIKLIALGLRYPRIKEALDYLINQFQLNFHSNWKPSFNLLFFAMSSNEASASIDTVSRVLHNNLYYKDITPEQQENCYEIRVHMREIYCLTQLIRTRIHEKRDPVIQDLYNLLDKYNLIFKKLFKFQVADTGVQGIMESYRRLRNSIAHSHFVLDENKNVKLVDWDKTSKTGKFIEYNLSDITKEILCFVGILCQIVALYQLMRQSKEAFNK